MNIESISYRSVVKRYMHDDRTLIFSPSVEVLSSQIEARRTILDTHHQSIINSRDALLPVLSPSLHRSIMLSSEKGSSSWVAALPLSDHGFCLHKGAFRDALCL